MNGVKFHMRKQGKSPSELAAQTGLPEHQIINMMEERLYAKPCHFYMRVSLALSVPVEMLIKQYPDDENGGDGMIWEERFERKPDTICRIYLAKITGSHVEYRYDRTFQHVSFRYSRDDIHCYQDNLEDGVYEEHARWYDMITGKVVYQHRRWFAVYEGDSYELDEQDVLHTLFNIEAQKGYKAS